MSKDKNGARPMIYKPGGGTETNVKLSTLQAQVDETAELMRDNITKTVERGEKLEDLDQRAEDLEQNTGQFQVKTRSIKRKYWWKNTKMKLIIAGVILTVIVIIILAIVFSVKPWEGGDSDSSSDNNAVNDGANNEANTVAPQPAPVSTTAPL